MKKHPFLKFLCPPSVFVVTATALIASETSSQIDPKNITPFDSQNPQSFIYRGYGYSQKGEWDKAIADYAEAVQLNSNNPTFYFYRGTAYSQKGDWDKSTSDYTDAIRLDPNNPMYYGDRGHDYYCEGGVSKSD